MELGYPMNTYRTLTELLLDGTNSSLLGFADETTPSIYDIFAPPLDAPGTPNTSPVSSGSNDREQSKEDEDDDQEEDDNQETKKTLKPKKTKQKKEVAPRFAFMTKSEVDHLEDGYRWRKYGQKAVKNSPFPRSYFRCTTLSCNVKKRVERCCDDPSTVVTTYEGQHTHQSPLFPRPRSVGPPLSYGRTSTLMPLPEQRIVATHHHQYFINNNGYSSVTLNPCGYMSNDPMNSPQPLGFGSQMSSASSSALLTDHGLLQDIVPRSLIKKED